MADSPQPSLIDPQVVNRLLNQQFHTRFPMAGSVSGHHKSPFRGSSVEFAEYRKYAPGDDIRRLDWRVFGRTDRFFIREFEADTNLRCYLVVDCSASMGYGAGEQTKFAYAQRLAASLGYLLVQQGDAVGLLCFDEKAACDIPPRRNPSHLQLIFNALRAAKPKGETALVKALHDLAEKVKQRALVMIFSDCFCDVEQLLGAFQHLRFQKHDLAVFHLLDRAEVEFQFDRPVRFVDMENSSSILTEPAVIRRQYLAQFEAYLLQLKQGCHRFNADYRRVITDENYEKVLADFLVERAALSGTR